MKLKAPLKCWPNSIILISIKAKNNNSKISIKPITCFPTKIVKDNTTLSILDSTKPIEILKNSIKSIRDTKEISLKGVMIQDSNKFLKNTEKYRKNICINT